MKCCIFKEINMMTATMETTTEVSLELALLEFQKRMASADDKANKIKMRAKLLHEVAVEKKIKALNKLWDAEREAEYIVQQALDDAEYIINVARQDAQVILKRSENEYDHMVHAFNARVNGIVTEASVQAHQT
jgi:vacuolar-type H+-ATPase subunit H